MASGTNLVSGAKSEYTYNGLLARVKKTSGTAALSYMSDYFSGIQNDLVTQISGVGTVNAVYGQGYGRASQRFMPQAGAETADTYFQHDLYGSTLFAADAQGVIKHHAAHDIWGMPKAVCDDSSIASGLRFTAYDYDSVLGKHFAHARMYDPSQGRMLGIDPVKRGLNGYTYCDNDPANQTDPTGEVANVIIGGIAGAVIGGAFGFAGSALSQLAEGKGFNARKAWGAAANGAIVGAARGALIASGAGIPLAFGVDFAAGDNDSSIEETIKILGSSTKEEFRVVGHGNEQGIEFRGRILGSKEVAHLIRHSPQYVGGKQRIRLYACSTGKKPDGFAQQLADILGVEVEAPNMLVYPTKDGEFMVGVLKGIEFTEGEWITFRPKFIK